MHLLIHFKTQVVNLHWQDGKTDKTVYDRNGSKQDHTVWDWKEKVTF